MKSRSGEKIKLTSYEELFGEPESETAEEIDLSQIVSFKNHPFRVVDDEKMSELTESIRKNGVLSPVLVRPTEDGNQYEMISGHRRMHAAKLAGLTKIPALVREMTDDAATIIMVDSNIQREELLPSEKAFAYKMKMDAVRHQGIASLSESNAISRDLIGEQHGISGRQINRYISLIKLIPDLLDMVDHGHHQSYIK